MHNKKKRRYTSNEEKDKIITFLTRENGKKAGIIYGAKSLRSQNVSSSEPFSKVKIIYVEKANRDLVSIRKCDIIDSYYPLRQDYQKFLFMSYVTELLLMCVIPPHDSEAFFELLEQSVMNFTETPSCPLAKLDFEIQLLGILGIFPNLEQCMQCHQTLWNTSSAHSQRVRFPQKHQFDSRQGGVLCPNCLHAHPDAVPISPGTLAYLRHQGSNRAASPGSKVRETLQNLIELNQVFFVYFRYHLGKTPRSHVFLKMNVH